MKRAGYKHAIQWIAENDGPGDDGAKDAAHVGGMVTVMLIADIFAVNRDRVARDVIAYRWQEQMQGNARQAADLVREGRGE